MNLSSQTYYVVKKGHKTGIFRTWLECKRSVDGYKNPKFRKFSSYSEASEFYGDGDGDGNSNVNSNSNSNGNANKTLLQTKSPVVSASIADMEKIKAMSANIKSSEYNEALNYNVSGWNIIDNEIYIFTDGSSRKSKEHFNSGIGVYIGFQCNNIKEQYNNKTNNQCELMAMDYAFKLIVRYYRELAEMGKVIKIVSDSEYTIKACSVWLSSWKKNNWKTAKGEDVKNKDIIESIDCSMLRIKLINSKLESDKKIKVKLIHVNSHQPPDMSDKFTFSIWFGNYIADGLAKNIM